MDPVCSEGNITRPCTLPGKCTSSSCRAPPQPAPQDLVKFRVWV